MLTKKPSNRNYLEFFDPLYWKVKPRNKTITDPIFMRFNLCEWILNSQADWRWYIALFAPPDFHRRPPLPCPTEKFHMALIEISLNKIAVKQITCCMKLFRRKTYTSTLQIVNENVVSHFHDNAVKSTNSWKFSRVFFCVDVLSSHAN